MVAPIVSSSHCPLRGGRSGAFHVELRRTRPNSPGPGESPKARECSEALRLGRAPCSSVGSRVARCLGHGLIVRRAALRAMCKAGLSSRSPRRRMSSLEGRPQADVPCGNSAHGVPSGYTRADRGAVPAGAMVRGGESGPSEVPANGVINGGEAARVRGAVPLRRSGGGFRWNFGARRGRRAHSHGPRCGCGGEDGPRR